MIHKPNASGRCGPDEWLIEIADGKWCVARGQTLMEVVDGKLNITIDQSISEEFAEHLTGNGFQLKGIVPEN